MNIKQLKTILEQYPEDLEVWSFCEGYGNAFVVENKDVKLETTTDKGVKKVILLIGIE